MAKTARKIAASASTAVIANTAMFSAMGKAQGDGRATAFRNDPTEENLQAILAAAEANLRKLMKGGKATKKVSLKIVAKNDKPAKSEKAMVKVADASDAQVKRAYKAEFDKVLATVSAMRKGLIKAGIKAIAAKAEKTETKPAKVIKSVKKVSKKVATKKPTKKAAKVVDNTKAIKSIKTKIEKLQTRREETEDKAKRAKLMASIRELRVELAALKA